MKSGEVHESTFQHLLILNATVYDYDDYVCDFVDVLLLGIISNIFFPSFTNPQFTFKGNFFLYFKF